LTTSTTADKGRGGGCEVGLRISAWGSWKFKEEGMPKKKKASKAKKKAPAKKKAAKRKK
jgi:hypothetical protein